MMLAHIWMALVLAAWLGASAPFPAGGGPGAGVQDGGPVEREDGQFETADELLTALERADADLARMGAQVTYIKKFAIAGDLEVRQGDLVYERAEEGKRFAVRFDLFINGSRVEDDPREYIFDGEWFVEKFIADREFIKRQVVPPGGRWDPMKLGEGPFPVPVGQRKAEVVREWEPALADSVEGVDHPRLVELARPLVQLRLVPREELADTADYAEVRVWYDRVDLLPRMLKATNFAGDETTVVLREVRVNSEVASPRISTAPPPAGEGWHVTVEPWQGEGATRVDTTVEVGRE